MSWQNEISPALINKFPELPSVEEAIAAEREGREIVTRCYKCGNVLTVSRVPNVSIRVGCGNGCTRYYVSYPVDTKRADSQ